MHLTATHHLHVFISNRRRPSRTINRRRLPHVADHNLPYISNCTRPFNCIGPARDYIDEVLKRFRVLIVTYVPSRGRKYVNTQMRRFFAGVVDAHYLWF